MSPATDPLPALVPPSLPASATTPATIEKSTIPTSDPPVHQMLDAAPIPSAIEKAPATSAPQAMSDAAVLQMHMGIRTSAFGNVEIHTVVEQSQVGVAIHGDRDLVRWFNSEVGGLAAGLKSQHLNLTAVDFDSTRSGVQTATGFQQGQPRQNFPQPSGANAAALVREGEVSGPETEPAATAPATGLPETRVSILV